MQESKGARGLDPRGQVLIKLLSRRSIYKYVSIFIYVLRPMVLLPRDGQSRRPLGCYLISPPRIFFFSLIFAGSLNISCTQAFAFHPDSAAKVCTSIL